MFDTNRCLETNMLNGDEVGPNKRNRVELLRAEHAHNTVMVYAGNQNRKKVRNQHGLLLEVERQGLVVSVDRNEYVHGKVDNRTYISMFATRTMTSLNWLCSQASAERSIMARAALSYRP